MAFYWGTCGLLASMQCIACQFLLDYASMFYCSLPQNYAHVHPFHAFINPIHTVTSPTQVCLQERKIYGSKLSEAALTVRENRIQLIICKMRWPFFACFDIYSCFTLLISLIFMLFDFYDFNWTKWSERAAAKKRE